MMNAAEIAATLGDGRGWQWRYCCPPRRQPIAEAARRAGCVMCWSGCDRAAICRAASTDGISSRLIRETAVQAESHHQMEPARDQEIGSGRLQRCGRFGAQAVKPAA